MPTNYATIEDIMAANEAAGDYWFSPGTMKFFACRVCPTVQHGRYFVTSEKAPHNPRGWTVREAQANGTIETVSDFMGLDSEQEAWEWLEDAMAAGEVY